ncbi:SU10 major capsid protein [Streptomyces sp. NPDC002092]
MPTELEEAITTAGAVTPLIPKAIDPVLLEYQRRYAPLLAAIPSKEWRSTQYFFNRRVQRPDSGGVTDGGARPIGNSTYEQAVFNIRLFQAVGSVTGYAQTVTRDIVGDLRQLELDGTVTSMLWSLENAFIWGNDGATANGLYPICSGLDYLVSNWTAGTGSNNYVNATDLAGANFALKHLDEIIDLVETNAAMPVGSQYMFIMSPRMASNVAQILTNQQRFMAPTVEIGAGLNVPSYRDVPIVKSSFLSPRTNQMGTVTTATATTGGTLAAATYYYQVSAVAARFGEISAATEVSQTTTGSTSTVTLSFSTPTNLPDGASPILYKVYRSTATGTETLVGVVDAFDTTGAAVTSIVDTGTNLLTNSSGNTGPSAYQGGNTGAKPRTVTNAAEDIYLVPRDPNFMVRPYTRDMQILPLAPTVAAPDTLPFAVLTDTTLAVRGPRYVGRGSRIVANI